MRLRQRVRIIIGPNEGKIGRTVRRLPMNGGTMFVVELIPEDVDGPHPGTALGATGVDARRVACSQAYLEPWPSS